MKNEKIYTSFSLAIERVERYEREYISQSYPASLVPGKRKKNREDYIEKGEKRKRKNDKKAPTYFQVWGMRSCNDLSAGVFM